MLRRSVVQSPALAAMLGSTDTTLSRSERSAAAGGSPARGPAIEPCAGLPPELGFHTLILGVRAGSLATGFSFGDGLVSKAAFWHFDWTHIESSCFILDIAIYIRRGVWSFWFSPRPPLNLVSNTLATLMKLSVVYIVIKPLFGEYSFNPYYIPNIGIEYSLCNCN